MIIISHRGNINGIVSERENSPSYIDCAIQLGFEVEVDLRYQNEQFWLGHDFIQYKIELPWMMNRVDKLWFHCKDKESAVELIKLDKNFKLFCHKNDDYVLTSTGHLWVHNFECRMDGYTIIPLLDEKSIIEFRNYDVYGICTDFPIKCK